MIVYWIVQTADGYWGRADSERAAKLVAKDEGSQMRRYTVFRITQPFDKPAPFIDKWGGLTHYGDPWTAVETTPHP